MSPAGPTPRDLWAEETLVRQRDVMAGAVAEAAAADDALEGCRRWLGVERQAAGYTRYLEPWTRGRFFDRIRPIIEDHRRALAGWSEQARGELGHYDDDVRERARQGLGLRLAVVGKGGAGKTCLTATLARLLARRGRRVLAVDLDTNPGLALSLGTPPSDVGLPEELLEKHPGGNYGWQLAAGTSPATAVERACVSGPDGVRMIGVGKISSVDKEAAKRSVPAVVQVLLGFGDPGWDVIADLEAGPTTPFERYHGFASDTLVVVGPAWRSAMTARRLWPMVASQNPVVVGNRFRQEPDHPGLTPSVRIPADECVTLAERRGEAPLDACSGSPAMQAVAGLARRLVPEHEEVPT